MVKHNLLNVFITNMFLHSFSQRHVTALPWAILRLITYFFARQTIQLAMLCIVIEISCDIYEIEFKN